jgi:hypothetical protein
MTDAKALDWPALLVRLKGGELRDALLMMADDVRSEEGARQLRRGALRPEGLRPHNSGLSSNGAHAFFVSELWVLWMIEKHQKPESYERYDYATLPDAVLDAMPFSAGFGNTGSQKFHKHYRGPKEAWACLLIGLEKL